MNQVSQRNYCAIKRTEFECESEDGESVKKNERSVTSFELNGLRPYTNYHCYARVENVESTEQPSEFSPRSEERLVQTKEGSESLIN